MERLTKVINACGKTVVVYTRGKYEDTTTGEMRHEDIRNVMRRLSDYEDTDLTPEQIMEMKERDTGVKPISSDRCNMCRNCCELLMPIDRFCPNCGQRIKWED